MVTVVLNIMFIVDTSRKIRDEQLAAQGDQFDNGIAREGMPSTITIEVLSSQAKVQVTVDGTTILDDSEPGKGRGIHVLVLNEVNGDTVTNWIN